MAETKQKVAELPQEEKEKLINEAKELDIRGVYTTMTVETLTKKIAEAKAAKEKTANPENEADTNKDETGTDENKAAENDAEKTQDTAADTKTKNKAPQVKKGNTTAYTQTAKKTNARICHICRSKVIDGKCTGCGFELHK